VNPLHLVVLAAGKGTRMKSRLPKVLHQVAGRPMIEYVLDTAAALTPETVTMIVGHEADMIRAALAARPGLRFALQAPQLGTGHALLQAEPLLAGKRGTLLLLSGDVPLLRADTLGRLRDAHESAAAAATVLTARVDRPDGYGRIVRTGGRIARIVEHRDAGEEERRITEINTGIYAFALEPLFAALHAIGSANAQGEYYLPDLVSIYRSRGLVVETVETGDMRDMQGINTRSDLAEAAAAVRRDRCEALMAGGVTIVDPATTYLGPEVRVGADTTLHPGVHLEGRTIVGERCDIRPGVRIVDSTIGDEVTILDHCLVTASSIGNGARLGPFAHVRPDSEVMAGAHVGNFVELKKTRLGEGSKANHLAYLGDATIGDGVNIGAGTITCNYDGETKHRTVIEDGAFIGSDTQLIAPVTVGRGAYVGAGSSITHDVPPGALAVARGKQVNKEGWAQGRKRRKTERSEADGRK
jgi:bifunctional UDP-N-acetylglucosamine pyrophosphorylase/glucosamine-1-phosphate N-acetyltransferase